MLVEPAAPEGLHHERTQLGWRRTALSGAAVTGLYLRSHIDRLDAAAVSVIVVSAAVVLVVLSMCYRRPSTTDGRVSAAIAALVAVIAVAQLAAIASS